MHHQHAGVVILVLVVGGTVAFTSVAVLIGLRMRRRIFAGAPRDQWDETRRGLSGREQRHVQWATMRRRPVSTAGLAPAQRAYISYARQMKIFHFALAAVWAALAILWGPVMSRSLARQPARMERLRAQINDRYGPPSPI
jgi:hypothetical protein